MKWSALHCQVFSCFSGFCSDFVAIATYQNYSNVTDTVDKEASSIAALDRDFNGFPPPVRGQLQDRLREYARFTIEDGWPQQRKGIVPTGGTERIASLFQVLLAFEPAKKSEELFQAEALREFNHLMELRRMRLANVLLGLPPVLWWVVAFGALMSVALIWLQDMEIHVHLILGGILASILAAVIFLIAMLDNRFRGGVGVGPDSIALVYETLMKPDGNGTAAGDAHQQSSPGSAPR